MKKLYPHEKKEGERDTEERKYIEFIENTKM